MHLAPTPEQQAVREQARRFLAAELTRERRLAWDASPEGHDAAFWRAVADLGWLAFGGLPAWLVWLFIHLMYLVEFENRVLVLWQWGWNYLTWNRGARLITGETRPR